MKARQELASYHQAVQDDISKLESEVAELEHKLTLLSFWLVAFDQTSGGIESIRSFTLGCAVSKILGKTIEIMNGLLDSYLNRMYTGDAPLSATLNGDLTLTEVFFV